MTASTFLENTMPSFTDEELNAITYAQYIADEPKDPVDNAFSLDEIEYYKDIAVKALNRNIEIYKIKIERSQNDCDNIIKCDELSECRFYLNQLTRSLDHICR